MDITYMLGNSRQNYGGQLTILIVQIVINHTKTDMRSSSTSNVKFFDKLACTKDSRDSKKRGAWVCYARTGLLMLFVLRSRGAIRLGLFCVAVLRANDPPFAALSSSYQKYHNHALFLLLIPTLLAMNELRWKYTIS